MILLICYRYANAEERMYFSTNKEVIIGRSRSNSATLDLSPDEQVSEKHASVFFDTNTWWLEDLGSASGTYHTGKRVSERTALRSGDELRIGESILHLYFDLNAPYVLDATDGYVEFEMGIPTHLPIGKITEHRRLEILGSIQQIASSRSGQMQLDGFKDEILRTFPSADNASIVFYGDKEIIPVSYSPLGKSNVSFTLARRAIHNRKAFIWERAAVSQTSQAIPSLLNVVSAMYSPIIHNRRVLGVLHVDTSSLGVSFEETDLEQLSEFATAIGHCIKPTIRNSLRIPSAFVSYAHEDKAFVDDLVERLRRIPVSVWYDDRLMVGEEWGAQVESAIETVDSFILVMSPASMASKWVRRELRYAKKQGKEILPLLLSLCKVPRELKQIQYIKIDSNYDAAVSELVDKLYDLYSS